MSATTSLPALSSGPRVCQVAHATSDWLDPQQPPYLPIWKSESMLNSWSRSVFSADGEVSSDDGGMITPLSSDEHSHGHAATALGLETSKGGMA